MHFETALRPNGCSVNDTLQASQKIPNQPLRSCLLSTDVT